MTAVDGRSRLGPLQSRHPAAGAAQLHRLPASWKLFLTGFLEPVFYLLSIGIGVGALVDTFEFNGQAGPLRRVRGARDARRVGVQRRAARLDVQRLLQAEVPKLYDQMLATPLTTRDVARGEIAWGQLRGSALRRGVPAVMLAMGLIHSWWAVLALPAALLIGFAFSAVCMALTTYMSRWQDFDKITLVQLPLFLFSATFFPVTAFPDAGPLDRRVHAALPRGGALPRAHHRRALVGLGGLGVYLLVMGLVGLVVVRRRLDALLLT